VVLILIAQELFSSHSSAPHLLITKQCLHHFLKPVREAKFILKKPALLLSINHCSLKPEILLRVANIPCCVVSLPSRHVINGLCRCKMTGSGFKALLMSVYADHTDHSVDKMLNGHVYSRAIRAHILTNLILVGIILNEVELIEEERAETKNKLRESERSLILFAKENETYQSLKGKFKTALHKLEDNGPLLKLRVQYLRMSTFVEFC
jgi:hypothetical protein